MNPNSSAFLVLAAACGFVTASCQGEGGPGAGEAAVHSLPADAGEIAHFLPAGSGAAIEIDYEILGVPVIGIPLSINVKVRSAIDEAITIDYRIPDPTGLAFSNAQAERVSLVAVGDDAFQAEQVTVIPQREGRLFLNVSAAVAAEDGTLSKVLAIPIQVGVQRATPGSMASGGVAGEAPIPRTGEEN